MKTFKEIVDMGIFEAAKYIQTLTQEEKDEIMSQFHPTEEQKKRLGQYEKAFDDWQQHNRIIQMDVDQ